METGKERHDRQDRNQNSTVLGRPNQEESRERRISWSILSNAAKRSRRHRAAILLSTNRFYKMITNREESSFSRVIFRIGRQVGIK